MPRAILTTALSFAASQRGDSATRRKGLPRRSRRITACAVYSSIAGGVAGVGRAARAVGSGDGHVVTRGQTATGVRPDCPRDRQGGLTQAGPGLHSGEPALRRPYSLQDHCLLEKVLPAAAAGAGEEALLPLAQLPIQEPEDQPG